MAICIIYVFEIKETKFGIFFINKAKKPAKLRVCRDTPTQKNVEAFHPTLENVYYLLLKSF